MVLNILNQPSHRARRKRRKAFWFSKKQSLAATRVVRSDRKWLQATYFTKPVKSVICGHLPSFEWPPETASDRWSKWPHAVVTKMLHIFLLPLTENAPKFSDRNEWQMLKGKGVTWNERGGVKTKRRVDNERDSTPSPSHTKRGNSKQNREVGTKSVDLKRKRWEAGPELIRERPETKEEASKRKDVWQKTGKGAYSKTTKGVIWNETQRSWNEKVWPQAEEAGPKLET